MKILIVGLNFYPELTGIGVYTYDFVRFLKGRGHEVEVVTTFPYYPQWERQPGYPRRLFFSEVVDGIQTHRCFTYVPTSPSSFKRIVHEGIFAKLAFLKMLFLPRPDIIIAICPPFLGMIACALICRMRSIKLHIHIQDLQPDAAFDLGMLRSKLLRRILLALEMWAYQSASLVSAIGESMLARIRAKGVPEDKLFYFPNWVTLPESEDSGGLGARAWQLQEKLNGKYTVLYAGSMGEKQGLDVLIGAAEIAQEREPDIQFLLVGNGARRQALESQAAQLKLGNVLFMDVLPQAAFLEILQQADVSVILQQSTVKDIVVPSKLLNILAVGSPVIAAVHRESETAKILSRLSVDTFAQEQTPRAFYEKIIEFKMDPGMVARLKQEERALAKELFDRETILSKAAMKIERYALSEHALRKTGSV